MCGKIDNLKRRIKMKAYFISPLRRLGLTTISLLLVLALLAASAPAAALAAPLSVTCAKNYVVQSGDTLSKIAVTYKLTVAELAAANNLKEPYTLFVGQQLCIPGTATTTTSTTSTATTSGPVTAEFDKNTVTLKFTGLTKNHGYVVKAAKVERGTLEWLKFGKFKSDKKGNASVTLKVPKRYRDATYLQICAKDLINDKVFCARFRRTISGPIS
jgi:murein DD-endopeptidase MepM/ murein hydrolase activator NlpD